MTEAPIDGRLCLGLRFQLRVMFRQKRSNVIGPGQTLFCL